MPDTSKTWPITSQFLCHRYITCQVSVPLSHESSVYFIFMIWKTGRGLLYLLDSVLIITSVISIKYNPLSVSLKCLLCKLEDLSSDSHHSYKNMTLL